MTALLKEINSIDCSGKSGSLSNESHFFKNNCSNSDSSVNLAADDVCPPCTANRIVLYSIVKIRWIVDERDARRCIVCDLLLSAVQGTVSIVSTNQPEEQ